MGAYCASKFALTGFTEALRDELMGTGVSVSLVCPGTTETPFFQTAQRGKMPSASRLILGVPAERVARTIVRAARRGPYRIIVPWPAALFMRMKELFPRTAHFLMRRISSLMPKETS